LGTGKGYSVFEMIRATEEITGKKVDYGMKDRRLGDPASLIASYELANETISWKPVFGLADIIQSAFEWRKEPLY
jgi:UDP-glucose 4-epimerase